jgi:hypothetical protein
MALPVMYSNAFPGSPGATPDRAGGQQREQREQRELLAAARRATAKRRQAAEDARRPAAAPRRQSLRRVKDSTEELRRTRLRGASNATIESSTTSTHTVANIHHGIIYLRYVCFVCLLGRLPGCAIFDMITSARPSIISHSYAR